MSAAESPWNKLLLAFQDIFQDLTIPIYQMHQCHWSSEAARNREKGEVITFHSKSCSGVPLMFTTKANFLRRLLGTRKPNQAGEILLSSLALSYQFRPLWIIYLHSFHLSTLGAFFFFFWCLTLHRGAPVVSSSFYCPMPAGREVGYPETDISYSLLRLWMKENGIPLDEWEAFH